MIRILFFISILSGGLFTACDQQKNEKEIRLSYNERREVDTLYREKIKILAPQLDSLCDLGKDTTLLKAIDSIKRIRKQEEIKLLNRTINE